MLFDFRGLFSSINALTFGIEWLIVDKFVGDEQTRNLLCDALGDRMSLIHEYGGIKKIKGQDELIRNQLKAGVKAEFIAKTNRVPLSRVRAIERTLKSEE